MKLRFGVPTVLCCCLLVGCAQKPPEGDPPSPDRMKIELMGKQVSMRPFVQISAPSEFGRFDVREQSKTPDSRLYDVAISLEVQDYGHCEGTIGVAYTKAASAWTLASVSPAGALDCPQRQALLQQAEEQRAEGWRQLHEAEAQAHAPLEALNKLHRYEHMCQRKFEGACEEVPALKAASCELGNSESC